MAGLTKKELEWMFIKSNSYIVEQLTQEFSNQDARFKAMLGVVLNAVNGEADVSEFKELLEQDQAAREAWAEELRESVKKDVIEIIENMDVIDGAPADDVAKAVVDMFTERLEE